MKRILKNKKGLLGLESIAQTINSIIEILPNWLKYILVIAILALVGILLSYMFNTFGIFCNSANLPVKTNANILQNLNLISEIPEPSLVGFEAQEATNCVYQAINQQITLENGTTTTFTGTALYDMGCIICTQKARTDQFFARVQDICLDSKIRGKTQDEKSWLQKITCGETECEPPTSYIYDNNIQAYTCAENNCAGRTIAQDYDEKLQKYHAELLYQNQDQNEINPSQENAIGITCTELKPKLAIFGIDILNPITFFVIMLLIISFWLYQKFA